MNHKRRKLLFLLAILLLLISLPVWWLNKEIHQERLNTALIAAIKRNDNNMVLTLLAAGADANARDRGNARPVAVSSLLADLFARLRGHSTGPQNAYCSPALLVHFSSPHVDHVDTFCSRGHRSVDVAVLHALLQYGAEADSRDAEGRTLLMWETDIQPYVLVYVGNRRILDASAPEQKRVPVELTRQLLACGADVNARDQTGRTPLMYCEDVEKARLLIAHGADIHARDNEGNTPLLHASRPDVANLFLRLGANVNARNTHGSTPLMRAVSRTDIDTIRVLLAHHADVTAKDKAGKTAFLLAQRQEQTIIGMLFDYVSDIEHLLKQHGAK